MSADPVEGVRAFSAVAEQLWSAGAEVFVGPPALARLSRAIAARASNTEALPSQLDLAVLVRQALRYHERSGGSRVPKLRVPTGEGWPEPEHWAKVGVLTGPIDGGHELQATPWRPEWLPDVGVGGVDGEAASERDRRQSDEVPGDPFLSLHLGRSSYRTRGQRSAVRAALLTPPGSTLVVCMPTGDGKSLIFQLIASVGFGSTDGLPGVTLVITPTVALGEDHQAAAEQLGLGGHPLAFSGDMPQEARKELFERIRAGSQRICFTSPEAACTTLRPALVDAARAGFLRAIVIDEAHLVDAWGANFRASFQVLSGVRSELLETAPLAARPRTFLLSATLTTSTMETLRTLFASAAGAEELRFLSAVQLRPEIEYWVANPIEDAQRKQRVREALLHMPRPAILYTTEVEHARTWHRELKAEGFRRLGLMTGQSSPDERKEVVRRWREGTLDLVVGTSAFGLGIDNPNVRTVIHACVPETIDRFYQEVGRGGRDGKASASIIIPTPRDQRIASVLNRRQLLTVENARERWTSMFQHPMATSEGGDAFRLPVDVPPGPGADRMDMEGKRNSEWHVKTLTLMANAGMIELLGPDAEAMEAGGIEITDARGDSDETVETVFHHFQRVRVLNPAHTDKRTWAELVEPQRRRLAQAGRENLARMLRFLRREECMSDSLAPIYAVDVPVDDRERVERVHVSRTCGGCPHCRSNGRVLDPEPAWNAKFPWAAREDLGAPAEHLLDADNRLVVFYAADPGQLGGRRERRWVEGLGRLARSGVLNLVVAPQAPVDPVRVQAAVPGIALFVSRHLAPNDLPPGPTMVVLAPGQAATDLLLRPRERSDAHFLFIPQDAPSPGTPWTTLRSRYGGGQFANLELFIRGVSS